jgi:hypothetical protein
MALEIGQERSRCYPMLALGRRCLEEKAGMAIFHCATKAWRHAADI